MRIHWLQHVSFEGLGSMEVHLGQLGHVLSHTGFFQTDELPALDQFDGLLVMGGPMSVHDEQQYPWLRKEKAFIKAAIESGKPVLGICLGAQLIAEQLGASVSTAAQKEIGWLPVYPVSPQADTWLAITEALPVFHWHGETFQLPHGATRLVESEACEQQGFVYNNRVVALQFHLETTAASAAAIVQHCGQELNGARYVQSAQQILSMGDASYRKINRHMAVLLDKLFSDD